MINEIYQYIEDCVGLIDQDLSLLDDPFGDDDYARTNEVEDGYKIIPSPSTTENQSNTFLRTFPITIEITKKCYREIIEDYKEVYNKALSIEGELISPSRVSNTNFSVIISGGITPEAFDDNDRTIKMLINISVLIYFNCD